MPEFYKKVVCTQFVLTEDEKAKIASGQTVYFESQPVKESAAGRYHILYKMADRLVPLHEYDWLVHNPALEIVRDHDFRKQYIQYDNIDPVALQQKLDALMEERNQNSI